VTAYATGIASIHAFLVSGAMLSWLMLSVATPSTAEIVAAPDSNPAVSPVL
jgi:hypothetical protein